MYKVRSEKRVMLSECIKKVLLYLIVSAVSLTMVLPFLWMLSASLKPETQVFDFPIRWIPEKFQWDNYKVVWTKLPFLTYYLNTLKVSVAVTLLQIVTCSMAAYSFSKIVFPERDKLFVVYLSTLMIPFQVMMIPQFIIVKNLGLVNHLTSVILLGAFSPFGVFLFRQFFLTIPDELLESARIDGYSELGIFAKIVLPLSKPAIASLVIFTFVASWNDFLAPLIYLNSDSVKTLQIGMRSFQTLYNSEYALLMAAATCATLPVILVYFFAQDYFIEGIVTTGLKG